MTKKKAFICVEKAGAGKSLDILASFIDLYNRDKVDCLLALAPKNAFDKKVWASECKQHTNIKAIDIETLYTKVGNSQQRLLQYLGHYQVITAKHTSVYKYDSIIKSILELTRAVVCVDEIHRFKSPASRLTIYAKLVLAKAYCRWSLTATPLAKDLKDCYNIINFIKPWYLGTFETFKKEYCTVRERVIGKLPNGKLRKVEEVTGVLNEAALQAKLYPIVITGGALLEPQFHYIDYQMGAREMHVYRKLAKGLFSPMDESETAEDWFKHVMQEEVVEDYKVKEVSRYSSRFLYLQFAANGLISDDGTIGNVSGAKYSIALKELSRIVEKKESCIIYFDYYASLDMMEKLIRQSNLDVAIVRATGKDAIDEYTITYEKVKQKPYVMLITRACSESISLWFINHVMFFEIPTVPSTMVQAVSRILRLNTIFDHDDLHCHILRSDNIDMYKLGVVCNKAAQSEVVVKEEKAIPEEYKEKFRNSSVLQLCKKYLL